MKSSVFTEQEIIKTVQNLAKTLNGDEVILLQGPLGAGKSVFARALIRALCGDETLEIPSPTFTLLQTYEGPKGPINHYDLYRLKDPEEIYELGWEVSLYNAIAIIEWPERLGPLTPPRRIEIVLSPVNNDPNARIIEITHVS